LAQATSKALCMAWICSGSKAKVREEAARIRASRLAAGAQSAPRCQPVCGHEELKPPSASLDHFGMMVGSPPGEPGGGITGVKPPPLGCAEMPGSTSGGGQITPLDRDNASLKLALPVVSPGGTAKPPVLAWQPKFGVDEIAGGGLRSVCAEAFVTAAIMVSPTMIKGRMTTS
jgi:hypothetical protein